MSTNHPINQPKISEQFNWQEPEGLALLRIPLGQEVQQIALAFASEQKDVKKGKQVLLNTLAVVAVHKCLKMFGFESYLESGECWNKVQKAMLNVADLLILDWGKIECFPILPEQKDIEVSPELLETRRGCVGIKFHQHLNYVEMFGFKLFDEQVKSQLRKTGILDVNDFEPFESIFNYIALPPIISILDYLRGQISSEQLKKAGWLTEDYIKNELELDKNNQLISFQTTKSNSKICLFKQIDNEDDNILYKILMAVTITIEKKNQRKVLIELFDLKGHKLPNFLQLSCNDTHHNSQLFNISSETNFIQSFPKQKAGELFKIYLSFKNKVVSSQLII